MPTFSHGSQAHTAIDASEGGALTTISAYVSNVSFTAERETSEFRGQGGAAVSRLIGPVACSYTVEGAFDSVLHAMFTTAMAAAAPVTRSFVHGPAGNTTGFPNETSEVYVVNYDHESDSENVNTWSVELVVNGAVTYGVF